MPVALAQRWWPVRSNKGLGVTVCGSNGDQSNRPVDANGHLHGKR